MERVVYDHFDRPTQVFFWGVDGEDQYLPGIAYKDEIICGCCGGIFEISDIYELTPAEVANPIALLDHWVDLTAEIAGGAEPPIVTPYEDGAIEDEEKFEHEANFSDKKD
jgi:hypothetical protein